MLSSLDHSIPYDPFVRGALPVGVCTVQALDRTRNRLFPCEIWYPANKQHLGQDLAPHTQDVFTVPPASTSRHQLAVRDARARIGTYPLIVYSHPSGGGRRAATFLCTHLSSHGYIVAALDHSELIAAELSRKDGESEVQKSARQNAWIASRVPDVSFLLDYVLDCGGWESHAKVDRARVGIVGHSFGGWTALAAPDIERRIRAVVALAPGGASNPKPGILRVNLSFAWKGDVPTLYLVAENDISLPLSGMYELFDRTPATKQMVILRHADHMHFMDNVEEMHEAVRKMQFTGELAWIQEEMRPISELCSGERANLFAGGLTVCHFDVNLKQQKEAQRLLAGDLEAELAARGIDAFTYKP